VTFRGRHAKRKRFEYHTLPGARLLDLVVRHVLPKGFRRARNFGFLHPNSKRAIVVLQWRFGRNPKHLIAHLKPRPPLACLCCGADMIIVQTGLLPQPPRAPVIPNLAANETPVMSPPRRAPSPGFRFPRADARARPEFGHHRPFKPSVPLNSPQWRVTTAARRDLRRHPRPAFSRPRKSYFLSPHSATIPGSSNKGFRSSLATLGRSNLIR
jgi:hypothetical protein